MPDFNHIFGKVNDNEMKRDDDHDDDDEMPRIMERFGIFIPEECKLNLSL
jgi:hypothetical protein